MRSSESEEMYLETIYVLHMSSSKVQAVDIARAMGFSKPTISERMNKLRQSGLITTDGSNIILTETGKSIAKKVYERHTVITKLLQGLGVSKELAEEDACRIEHYISNETFECMKTHLAQLEKERG